MAELTEHLSAYLVDRHLAGLLDAARAAEVEAHAHACPACEAQLATARRAKDTFLAHNPPALRVEQLLAARRPRFRWWWIAPLVPIAVALLLWLRPVPGVQMSVREVDDAELGVVGAGNRIEVHVTPARHQHVAVYALSDRDDWTLIVDAELEGPLAVPHDLPRGAPHAQRIIAVFSDAAVAEDTIRTAATRARAEAGGIEKMGAFGIEGHPRAVVRTVLRK